MCCHYFIENMLLINIHCLYVISRNYRLFRVIIC